MTKRKVFVVMLLAVFCCGLLLCLASCEPLTYFGVTVYGVSTNGVSQVDLKSVNYQFNIIDFPMVTDYDDAKTDSTVEITYRYYNSTESDITMPLYVVKNRPQYDYYKSVDDSFRYKFETTADNEVILRCALNEQLNYSYSSTSVDEFLKNISDERQYDSVYNSEMTVYKYTYGINKLSDKATRLYFEKSKTNDKMFVDKNVYRYYGEEDGNARYYVYLENASTVTLYSLGRELVNVDDSFSFCDNWENAVTNGGEFVLLDEETISFDELAMVRYDDESGLSKIDWYNAVLTYIKNDKSVFVDDLDYFDVTDGLSYMYQCNLTVPAQKDVVLTVETPLYPTVDCSRYDENVYDYYLDMSSLSQWRGSPEVNLFITTNGYYVSSEKELTTTDTGFELKQIEPSTKDWYFTLSQTPNYDKNDNTIAASILGGVGMIILIVALAVSVVPIVTVAIVLAHDRSKRNR